MSVVLARVDSRLVHGQVLESWVPHVGADVIVVVGEAESRDPFRRSLFEALSTPRLRVRVVGPGEAVRVVGEEGPHRVLVLFPDVEAAWVAFRAGLRFDRLNLGNVHPREGGRPVSRTVYLTKEDLEELRSLSAEGVAVDVGAVPSELAPAPEAVLGGRG